MAAELIGRCTCPVCRGSARLTLAKSRLSVVTCNGCNFQGFARSDRSDEKLRALVIQEAADKPATAADPVPPMKPAPIAAAAEAVAAEARSGFRLGGAWRG